MSRFVELRRGAYRDSVALMQVSKTVAAAEGVTAAHVAMATELNLELLEDMGFTRPEEASPADMLVAIAAADDDALERAHAVLERALAERATSVPDHGGSGQAPPPRTTASGANRSSASLALISVPRRNAFVEAMDALQAGLSVMLFSDNVPVEQEIRLKDEAAARGLLVMGPDCGTAAIGGVGLGFANALCPGPVGIVGASGTGSQELMCLLDAAGVGVSHCLGVGGRDLSADVGGRSTRQALAALDADPATELIVVVSKPPASEVAREVRALAQRLTTPTQFALLGPGEEDLTAAAAKAVAAVGAADAAGPAPTAGPAATAGAADPAGDADDTGGSGGSGGAGRGANAEARAETTPPEPAAWPEWPAPVAQRPRHGALRGLFCGGTLCDEAMVIAAAALGPVASNVPLTPEWALDDDLRSAGHLMIDFGDDRLTEGRPHPMIDPYPRLQRFAEEVTDPQTAVVHMDVLLGYGVHPDPAADLAAAIADVRGRGYDVPVVVTLVGTASDPQGLEAQATALREAGAHVFLSNAAAARHAVGLVATESAGYSTGCSTGCSTG